jgi:hypothetical protein
LSNLCLQSVFKAKLKAGPGDVGKRGGKGEKRGGGMVCVLGGGLISNPTG